MKSRRAPGAGIKLPVWGWAAVWIVVAGLVVLPHVRAFTKLSPIDEYQHVDYLTKVMDLGLVHGGDRVDQTAMREQACRGTELPGVVLPRCSSKHFKAKAFPGGGFNHTFTDPPAYYLITAPLVAALLWLPGVESVVTAARGVGVLWLGLGLMVTFLLARRVRATPTAAFGATALIASNPTVVEASATVTTDAPALLVGGLLCLLAVAVVERRASWGWLVPAAAFAMLVKTTSLAVVGLVVVFLLICVISERRLRRAAPPDAERTAVAAAPAAGGSHVAIRSVPDESAPTSEVVVRTASRGRRASPPSSQWSAALAVVLGGGLAALAWFVYMKTTATGPVDEIPAFQMFHRDSIGLSELATQSLSLTSVLANAYVPHFLDSPTVKQLAILVNGVVFIGVASTAWFGAWRQTSTRLAAATLTSMLVSGVGFTVIFFVGTHIYGNIAGRYGLSIVPAAVAALAVAADRRQWGGWALTGLAAVSMGVLLAHTL
jgi:hypothetical protein